MDEQATNTFFLIKLKLNGGSGQYCYFYAMIIWLVKQSFQTYSGSLYWQTDVDMLWQLKYWPDIPLNLIVSSQVADC